MVKPQTHAASTSPRRRTLPQRVDTPPSLKSLQQLEAFQAANAHVFPSVPSLRWFYRQHRDELLKSGAVIEIAGRLLVNAPVFTKKAIEIGARVATMRGQSAAEVPAV